MNHKELIEDLLNELSYRVGIVNIYNKEQQSIMSEILTEWGEIDAKYKIMSFLTEKGKTPDMNQQKDDTEGEDRDYTHIGRGIYVRKGDEGKDNAQKYRKGTSGKLQAITPDEYEKIKSQQGAEGEKAASTTSQNQKGDETSVDDVETQKGIEQTLGPNSEYGKKQAALKTKVDSDGQTSELDYESTSKTNLKNIEKFIEVGFDDSKGAPGNRGSMLNETTSIISATDFLNNGQEFNYDNALSKNIELLKDSKLGAENDGTKPAGRIKMAEAKVVAQQYGISVGLASKIIIATKAAKKKNERVKSTILEKNNITNFEAVPLFGDSNGLDLQRNLIRNTKGEIKLGNTTITQEEALKIIDESGGGNNPSDTAIFVLDKDTGNLHMSFFSDKDATNAIVAQSSLSAENELKKQEIDDLVKDGVLSEEDSVYYKSIMDTSIKEFQDLEESLSKVVNGPGEHLQSQDVNSLVEKAKSLSAGKTPDKYWKAVVVGKFTSSRNPAYKTIVPMLPEGHSEPPTDSEMMETYIRWINLPENQGNLSKPDQRVVTDLSNQTNGPKLGSALGEIRKKSIEADLNLIKKLDEKKVTIDGREVGLGTLLEAKSVGEKLHLNILFGGDGVYQDSEAFCQENGGVTVTKEVMNNCLPYSSRTDSFVNFEVGEEVDQLQRGGKVVTGGSKIVYAITKEGNRYPIGEKKQRSKQGPLGKLSTVYNFHPELQKCFDKNGK